MNPALTAVPFLFLTALAGAQTQTVLLPAAATPIAAGNGTDQAAWTNSFLGWPGLHGQVVYGAANFAARGIGGPILVQRVRFRAATTGGAVTITGAQIGMGTSARAYAQLSSTFADQVGPDFAVVFSGTIQVASVPSLPVPGPMFVDVPFQTPFRYDPTQGDLLLDLGYQFANLGGNPPAAQNDMIVGASALARSMVGSSSFPFALVQTNAAQVIELDYVPAPGAATAAPYGVGCPHQRAAIAELFEAPFDLSGSPTSATVLHFARGSTGYTISNGVGTYVPVHANVLPLFDEWSQVVSLPFAFPYPGADGSLQTTTSIDVADNGYLWLDAATSSGAESPANVSWFSGHGARIAPFWHGLDPAFGTVSHGSLGADYAVSWDQLAESGGPGVVRAMVVLRQNGDFDLVFGETTGPWIGVPLTGFSPGGAKLADRIDLSAALPWTTRPDADPLRISASARPVLGTVPSVLFADVPPNAVLGVVVLGFVQLGIPLGVIGMPGCTQFATVDATYIVPGVAAVPAWPFPIPNSALLTGLPLNLELAAFATGFNPLGVIASNGLALVLGSN